MYLLIHFIQIKSILLFWIRGWLESWMTEIGTQWGEKAVCIRARKKRRREKLDAPKLLSLQHRYTPERQRARALERLLLLPQSIGRCMLCAFVCVPAPSPPWKKHMHFESFPKFLLLPLLLQPPLMENSCLAAWNCEGMKIYVPHIKRNMKIATHIDTNSLALFLIIHVLVFSFACCVAFSIEACTLAMDMF